ncbi:hypothetical protein [Streptomyces sp. NPDC051219]|uniref:hypothetical protein n=1 Tax=Streptomyces sp. NPDC051219 TaxID=3155283 RepID=UPI0034453E26
MFGDRDGPRDGLDDPPVAAGTPPGGLWQTAARSPTASPTRGGPRNSTTNCRSPRPRSWSPFSQARRAGQTIAVGPGATRFHAGLDKVNDVIEQSVTLRAQLADDGPQLPPDQRGQTPLLGACQPARCRNSVLTLAHEPIWRMEETDLVELLKKLSKTLREQALTRLAEVRSATTQFDRPGVVALHFPRGERRGAVVLGEGPAFDLMDLAVAHGRQRGDEDVAGSPEHTVLERLAETGRSHTGTVRDPSFAPLAEERLIHRDRVVREWLENPDHSIPVHPADDQVAWAGEPNWTERADVA